MMQLLRSSSRVRFALARTGAIGAAPGRASPHVGVLGAVAAGPTTFSPSRWLSTDVQEEGTAKANKKTPTITQNYPMRPWLESPVDLNATSSDEAQNLWRSLGGDDHLMLTGPRLVQSIAERTFQIALGSLESAKSTEELEEVRSLIAIAVAHGNAKAKLYCARLFLLGDWPISIPPKGQTIDDVNDKRTAKEKGMAVIKEIRAIQKKRKKGERFDAKPPRDVKKAIELFRELGSQVGVIDKRTAGEALLEIGDAHFFPGEEYAEESVKLVSANEALSAYEKAARDLGAPGAWYRLGSALEQGSEIDGLQGNSVAARKCFERAVEAEDDPEAHVYLAHYYRTEGNDPNRARSHLLRAAQQHNSSSAQVYLARWALEEGKEGEALQWLLSAEKLGDAEAAHLLADAHLQGSLGLEKDLRRAVKLYRIAGEGGSEDAWLSAGALHFEMEEYEDAFKCYEQAAEMGSSDAWTRIADLYMSGRGVPQSKETAVRILELLKSNQGTS